MNTVKLNSTPRQSIALLTLAQNFPHPQTDCTTHLSDSLKLAQSLTKLGWQIDLVTTQAQPDEPKITEPSPFCRIVRLPSNLPEASSPAAFLEDVSAFVEDFYAFQTKQGTSYPLIHTLDGEAGQVGLRLKQTRAVQWVHTIWQEQPNLQAAYSPADQTVVFRSGSRSQRLEHSLRDLDSRSPHPSFSKGSISKSEAKRKLGLSPLDHVGLYLGSFHSIQGIDVLIEALALHRDRLQRATGTTARPLKCLFVFNGSEFQEQRVQQRLEELNLNHLVLLAEQDSCKEDLFHAAADVRLMPSLWEPFGTAALSALDCGMPVIASNTDGFRFTVIPEETGLLVPPNHSIALSEAIDRIVFNDMWMQRLKRQTADASSGWDRTAAHLSDLYRRLLAQTLSPFIPQPQNSYTLSIPSTTLVQAAAPTAADFMQDLVQVS
jgi:glycosyltransferase involved in cell wall biosynthesis